MCQVCQVVMHSGIDANVRCRRQLALFGAWRYVNHCLGALLTWFSEAGKSKLVCRNNISLRHTMGGYTTFTIPNVFEVRYRVRIPCKLARLNLLSWSVLSLRLFPVMKSTPWRCWVLRLLKKTVRTKSENGPGRGWECSVG